MRWNSWGDEIAISLNGNRFSFYSLLSHFLSPFLFLAPSLFLSHCYFFMETCWWGWKFFLLLFTAERCFPLISPHLLISLPSPSFFFFPSLYFLFFFPSLKLSFFTYFLHQRHTFIEFEFFFLTPQIDLSSVPFLERSFSSIILLPASFSPFVTKKRWEMK